MRFAVQVSSPLVAIGASQFALSLLQVVFMFFYVKVYLNVFHVSQWWFNVAQALFMVWNAVNDPLFGYLQDSNTGWMRSRTAVLTRFSPFLCGSFVLLWFPWDISGSWLEGLHLICALFLYDAFFSAMGVSWAALFADSTKDARSRAAAMKYSQMAILGSVNGIAIMEKASHSLENFSAFQTGAILMALLALFCLLSAGSYRPTLPISREKDDEERLLNGDDVASSEHETGTWSHAFELTRQTVRQHDFLFIIATNFIHIMRSVAHLNFASITTEILVPQDILPRGSLKLSIFYGFCTLGPQLIIIALEKVVVRVGAGRLLLFSYLVSAIAAICFSFFSGWPYIVMLFMLIDAITVHSAAPLFNIIISDYIDEDTKRYSRRSPISSFVFSLNALFTKPAQSVAPVLIVQLLNAYGYQAYLVDKLSTEALRAAVQYVLYGTPLVLGALQYCVFSRYSLLHKPSKELVI
ncbi:unnamed protein product, partial [Mesorhabditis spiculigera]